MFNENQHLCANTPPPFTDNLNVCGQDQNIRKTLHSLQPSANDPSTLVGSARAVIKQKELRKKDEKCDSPMKKVGIKQKQLHRARSSRQNKILEESKVPYKLTEYEIENMLKSEIKSSVTMRKNSKKISRKLTSKLKITGLSDSTNDKSALVEQEVHLFSPVPGDISKRISGSIKEFINCSSGAVVESKEAKENKRTVGYCKETHKIASSCKDPPDDVHDLLLNSEVPDGYWKLLAEQRRVALEKALHENELLHDQLEVLETENIQLNLLVKEAEHFVGSVKEMFGET